MDTSIIFKFLRDIAANNNRQWFGEHRDEYEKARASFEADIAKTIVAISEFDPDVAHLSVKDVTYRFYRDTRFSPDKSPYKRHLGAYIAAHGKKSHHGGYYIHLEPGRCLLACNDYCLPTNILNACRNEIMSNAEQWLACVESDKFRLNFGKAGTGSFGDDKGFGIERLKTCPTGFPKDYQYIQYIRMKDFCCWQHVDDTFFALPNWQEKACQIFKAAKPMMDFINAVVDDYE